MSTANIGELAALGTACCWTVSALVFEKATNKIGSLAVNLIRLFFAVLIIGFYTWIVRGLFLPTDATLLNWFWLSVSGLIGFVIGDFMLFKSYTYIGSRVSMLIMTMVPPITAIIGWFFLHEVLNVFQIIGMIITILGIFLVIATRNNVSGEKKLHISGLLLAFGAAICQSLGLVISKFGMAGYNAFASTQIRIISGIVGFSMLVLIFRKTNSIRTGFKDKGVLILLLIGAIFGPFLGVSLSLFSVQHANSGVASTIMSIVPVLMIPVAIFLYKQKVSLMEIIGILMSVSGVALLFY